MRELLLSKQGIKILFSDIKGLLLGVIIAFFVITYWFSTKPFIEEVKEPISPRVVVAGKEFEYCRIVNYLSKVRIELSKEIIQHTDGRQILHPQFSTQKFTRTKGQRIFCKKFRFPEYSEEGKYIMHTQITATLFPFWNSTFEFSNIEFNVIKDK